MIAWLLIACGANGGVPAGPSEGSSSKGPVPAGCPTVGPAGVSGSVASSELTEISGLAASARHDVLWAHNDSGGLPRVYAIGLDGADRGSVLIEGAEALDWEDITRVPGEAHDWLILADIGDNKEARASVQLYRVPEPTPGTDTTAKAERMDVRWPSGPINAETLLADPRSGELFVLSKVKEGASVLYALGPFTAGKVEARAVGARSFPPGKSSVRTTGGDISPDGKWLVVRTYTQAHLFPIEGSIPDALLRPWCDIPTPDEAQGEAITFRDGALILISEGEHPAVNRIPLGPG